jgi:hypothetical protein
MIRSRAGVSVGYSMLRCVNHHTTRGRAAPSSNKLAYAVVDGPDGAHAVVLPAGRSAALQIKDQYRETFWCSTQAGGCGARLIVAAGPVLRPHYRHKDGMDGCALADDGARAERSYEHLRYQHALSAWLADQGLHATMEKVLGADSRADLHVVIDGRSQTLEVQLSPIAGNVWRDRDEKYRSHVDHVTWLYGSGAEAAAATEQAARGHALHLRTAAAAIQASGEARAAVEAAHAETVVEVGVVTHLGEAWSRLAVCQLRSDGVWTPDLDQALSDLAAAENMAAELARREAERRAAAGAAAVERPVMWKPQALSAGTPGEGYGTTSWWTRTFPGLALWAPDRGWGWTEDLDENARTAARRLCYIVQRLYASGPVNMLMAPDEPELTTASAIAALERAGFLNLDERNGGVQRWRRGEALPG